jgi:isocitrate dehydrogenase
MKIQMNVPLAELDGDEMTRILWKMIKEHLIEPCVDLKAEYYDLGLVNRDATGDKVTTDAAEAIKRLGVGVKCATITANKQRVEEYNLKQMWLSPNATIRAALDGTVFRAPIIVEGIKRYVPGWRKPITIARHAYGDVYKAAESVVKGGRAELLVTDCEGNETRLPVHEFDGGGVLMAVHNLDSSIESFARACFNYALDVEQDLWFSTKDTILKQYDGRFKEIFEYIYTNEFNERFKAANIKYFYTLIDDAVARAVRSEGGFVWALKNYDGDVLSDMVAAAYGSLSMMTSVLVSPGGQYEYEAAHGTVTQHYYRHLRGESTSTNPIATIFAWSGALRKRGELDGISELTAFAGQLERAVIDTLAGGIMTGDLAGLYSGEATTVTSEEFIKAVAIKI